MPIYQSKAGQWFPVDAEAKKECKELGIETRGKSGQMIAGPTGSVHHTWRDNPANFPADQGVLAVPIIPKVAVGKFDGIHIAEPTPAQKAQLEKGKEGKE